MQVGDLVKHKGWEEDGLIVKVLRHDAFGRGLGGVFEVMVFGRVHRSQWASRDLELISECKKITKKVIIRGACLGAGILLVASIPLWGFIFRKHK